MVASSHSTLKPKLLLGSIALVVSGILFYFLPLFHIVPLKEAQAEASAAEFDPVAYVDEFWNGKLIEEAERAVDVEELLAAFERDPAAAAQQYGHKLGVSGSTSYFVAGTGTVVATDNGNMEITLAGGDQPAVLIKTGPVFGNAIRDGSGLLDVSKFPNSRDFNEISSAINRRVEEEVFPLLKEYAAIGKTIRFVGAVDIADTATAIVPLKLVPVLIDFP